MDPIPLKESVEDDGKGLTELGPVHLVTMSDLKREVSTCTNYFAYSSHYSSASWTLIIPAIWILMKSNSLHRLLAWR